MILSRMRMMGVDEAEVGKDAADDEMGRAYGMRTGRPRVLSARSLEYAGGKSPHSWRGCATCARVLSSHQRCSTPGPDS
jgi:hypothetical protein